MNDIDVHSGNLTKMYEESTDEYYTPTEIVGPLSSAVGGFDLDPCTNNQFDSIASNTFEEDGLEEDWFGDVWLNPPYSKIGPWLSKANEGVIDGTIDSVTALVPYRTQTQWFQRNFDAVSAVCFVEGCISFGDSTDTAPFGNIILFYGELNGNIISALNEHGIVISCN